MLLGAENTPEAFSPWISLVQAGIVGVVLIMIVRGVGIVTRRELDRAERQIVELQKSLAEKDEVILRQTDVMENRVIPALVRATDLAADRVKARGD